MTQPDFDRIARELNSRLFAAERGTKWNEQIRAALIDAWNAALEAAGRATDELQSHYMGNAEKTKAFPEASAAWVQIAGALINVAATVRAKKLPTGGP